MTRADRSRTRTTIRLLALATLVATAALLPACNTVEGAGKDVEALGKGTSEVARDASDAISGKK